MRIDTDNRLFERVEGELVLRYSLQGSDREFSAVTKNISGSGIRTSLLKKLNPGTLLDVEISRCNTAIKARCRGKVVWVWGEPMGRDSEQLFETGIEFINGRLFYIGRLISYLESQNKKTYYE